MAPDRKGVCFAIPYRTGVLNEMQAFGVPVHLSALQKLRTLDLTDAITLQVEMWPNG